MRSTGPSARLPQIQSCYAMTAGDGRNPGVPSPASHSVSPRRWQPRFAERQSRGLAAVVRSVICSGPLSFLLRTVDRSLPWHAEPGGVVLPSSPRPSRTWGRPVAIGLLGAYAVERWKSGIHAVAVGYRLCSPPRFGRSRSGHLRTTLVVAPYPCLIGRGRSTVERAPEWHSGGQGFDSPRLHHADVCASKRQDVS